jgi:hypothetical protein
VDLDQDVILPHFRVWNFADPHAIRASIAIDDECFHVALLVPELDRLPFQDRRARQRRRRRVEPQSPPNAGVHQSRRRQSAKQRFASPPAA